MTVDTGPATWCTLGRTLRPPRPYRKEVHPLEPAMRRRDVSVRTSQHQHDPDEETRKLAGIVPRSWNSPTSKSIHVQGVHHMKKLLITLLVAVVASGAFAQSSFPDIPANHWAGDAVTRIADLGIVIGFPDGTFRGNEAFTRYQAALVVSRLLDVINDNVNAALAMTQAAVDSLRNAAQEIASAAAAQGVRLSAAESAIAGLSDDVTGNAARLDALEAAMAGGGVDPAVLRDLQNQIASQRVAIDTAQAQADAAAARADDAYSLANQANALGRQNAEEIAALNRMAQILSERIDDLESALAGASFGGGSGDTAALADAIERNRSDIANLREFVILL